LLCLGGRSFFVCISAGLTNKVVVANVLVMFRW